MRRWRSLGAALSGIAVGFAAHTVFPRTEIFPLIVVGILSGLAGVVLFAITREDGLSYHKSNSETIARKMVPEQINGHFLFSALHYISLTMPTDVGKAGQCVQDLGQFLRLVLEMRTSESVILAQELRCVDYYLKIEKERLGSRLTVVRQIDPHCLEVPLPCFTILPLVENSIFHGVEKSPDAVTIFILVQLADAGMRIEISDTGAGMETAQLQHVLKTGPTLAGVRRRLLSMYGRSAKMELQALAPSGFRVVLTFPYSRV